MTRIPDAGERRAPQGPAPARSPPEASAAPARSGALAGLESLTRLLPDKLGELETEDFILLLILYLMYRESGDSELLIIMGAMFLL